MIPLSMEKLSTGNPAICQARTVIGSPSVEFNENTGEHGIPWAEHTFLHSAVQSYVQVCESICERKTTIKDDS